MALVGKNKPFQLVFHGPKWLTKMGINIETIHEGYFLTNEIYRNVTRVLEHCSTSVSSVAKKGHRPTYPPCQNLSWLKMMGLKTGNSFQNTAMFGTPSKTNMTMENPHF